MCNINGEILFKTQSDNQGHLLTKLVIYYITELKKHTDMHGEH